MKNLVERWMNSAVRAPDGGGGGGAASPSGGGGGGGGEAAPSSPSGGGGSAPGGSTAAPSATPSTSAPDDGGGMDWSALGSGEDLDHFVEIPPETPPAVEPESAPTTVPPPAVPSTPQTPTPVVQTPSVSEPGRELPPLTASDPWRIAEGIEANRDAIVAHLAAAKFALSEADIKDLDTDVTAAVPRLLARVYVESQVSMQKFLAQAVPGMMKQYNSVSSANGEAEKQFFAAHPALDAKNPQHRATAIRIATVYRQANPSIPLQQLIAEVGPMVMTALQLQGKPVAPPQAAAQVARSAAGAFRPAVNGGGGYSPAAESPNEWAGLGRNYD